MKPLGLLTNPTMKRGGNNHCACGALRLAQFFGNRQEFWLNLRQMHNLSKARLELSKTIERDVKA